MRFAVLFTLLLVQASFAGTFEFISKADDPNIVVFMKDPANEPGVIYYYGIVETWDAPDLKAVVKATGAKTVLISSPGGSAAGGIRLFDAARELKLNTCAMGMGAWSAAGMFWLGGANTRIIGDCQVGFHYAYNGFSEQPAPQVFHAAVGSRTALAFGTAEPADDLLFAQQVAYDKFGIAGFAVMTNTDNGNGPYQLDVIDTMSAEGKVPSQVREYMDRLLKQIRNQKKDATK